MITPLCLGSMLTVLAGVGTPAARAQTVFWNTSSAAGGSWGNSSNWQGGVVASGSGTTAAFALNFNAGASVTLDGSRTIGTVSTTSANSWSLDTGTGGTLTVANVTVN